MKKYFTIAVLVALASYFLRDYVSTVGYAAYKDSLAALLNVASIIFAIIGAWIAVVYPRAIGRMFVGVEVGHPEFQEASDDMKYFSELVEIVMVSALVLMLVIAIQFAAPIFNSYLLKVSEIGTRVVFFYVVSTLTVVQLYAVFRVIMTNYFFLNQLRKKNANAEIDVLHN